MHFAWRIETLESRLLLAADAALSEFHGKLQSGAWQEMQSVTASKDAAARFDAGGRVQVDLHLHGKMSDAIDALRRLGVSAAARDDAAGVVELWTPPAMLWRISALASVTSITLPDYARVRAGGVDSAGDSLLLADRVRSQFAAYGIDGSGVKVGVISDGADHRADVSSDLPAITVNPSLPGSGDEGTAMLEIVHDLAPGAQLYFSGPDTSVEMVDSINWLVSQGCNVIVDDLGFFTEPFFTDGPVATAAQNAVNSGVVYVSAAGNESTPIGSVGDFHYEHPFVDDGSADHLHNFNSAGTTPDDFMDFYVRPHGSVDVVLQWSDPFGASADDYDLQLFASNHSTVLARSEGAQTGTQDPIESLHYDNFNSTSTKVAIRIEKFTGDPRELEMFVLGDAQSIEYATPGGAIIGQPAASGAIAVGAIDAADTGTDAVESYSSQGPRTIYTDFATQTKITRNVLAGVGIDGVQTRVGQSGDFANPFYGTSAAAPGVAAIAALMRDANPSLSAESTRQILMDTAVDLPAYGAGYDQISGAGRFNALDAVYKAFIPPAAPDLAANSDSGISNIDNLTNLSKLTFTGTAPLASYVSLYVDGVFNSGVQLSSSGNTYSVMSTTLSDGAHSVMMRLSSGASEPPSNLSAESSGLPIVIDRTAPTITAVGFDLMSGKAMLFLSSEDISATLHGGKLHVREDDDELDVQDADEVVKTFPTLGQYLVQIQFRDSTEPLLEDGNYSATLDTSGATDPAGNPAMAPPAVDFFVLAGDANRDRTVNALDFNALASHFGESSAVFSDGDFNFDGTVDAADFTALALRFNKTLAPAAPPAAAQPLFGSDPVTAPLVTDILSVPAEIPIS